jgi:hypothetical protein
MGLPVGGPLAAPGIAMVENSAMGRLGIGNRAVHHTFRSRPFPLGLWGGSLRVFGGLGTSGELGEAPGAVETSR